MKDRHYFSADNSSTDQEQTPLFMINEGTILCSKQPSAGSCPEL